MNVFHRFTEHVRAAVTTLAQAGVFPSPPDLSRIVVEPPREASHGDLATNAAMALAKDAGLKPRDLAEKIAAELGKLPEVTRTEIAGPGFINLTLDPAVWRTALADIVRIGAEYGHSSIGAGKPVNVEYVSANPTGPMHVGHCRDARVLHQRCGRAGRCAGALGASSLPRGTRRKHWRHPGGTLSGRLSQAC